MTPQSPSQQVQHVLSLSHTRATHMHAHNTRATHMHTFPGKTTSNYFWKILDENKSEDEEFCFSYRIWFVGVIQCSKLYC